LVLDIVGIRTPEKMICDTDIYLPVSMKGEIREKRILFIAVKLTSISGCGNTGLQIKKA
jgi:hypothetical protein